MTPPSAIYRSSEFTLNTASLHLTEKPPSVPVGDFPDMCQVLVAAVVENKQLVEFSAAHDSLKGRNGASEG